MWYYIRHYFEHSFDHTHLKPLADARGSINLRNLNYVQNAVKGQVLAEVLPLTKDMSPLPEKRFIRSEPTLPMGPNTAINPENPNQLISTINGFVFYNHNEITVKHLLNVRRDIDLHTGNIAFVGDLAVYGDVHSEFELRANNILVKGIIEGAFLRAVGSIVGEGGLKGGQSGKVIADGDIRLAFAETGEIRAQGKVAIDGSCMHCNIYSGSDVVVQGRLLGGVVRARKKVFVSSRAGLASDTQTQIILGEDPFIYRMLRKNEEEYQRVSSLLESYEKLIEHHKKANNHDFEKKYKLIAKKKEIYCKKVHDLKQQLATSCSTKDAMLIVPGEILPGVTVTIGGVSLKIEKPETNVRLKLVNGEIVIRYPAIPKKSRLG